MQRLWPFYGRIVMNAHLLHFKDQLTDDFQFKFIRHKGLKFQQSLHMHDYIQIAYVVRGVGNHHFLDKTLTVGKGDLFIIPPLKAHSINTIDGKELEFVLLDFMPAFLGDHLRPFSRSVFHHVTQFEKSGTSSEWLQPWLHISQDKQLLVEQLLQDIQEEIEEREEGYEFSVQINVVKLLILIDREFRKTERQRHQAACQKPQYQQFQDVVRHIHENYGQDIPLEQGAYIANMTPAYFSHLFKKATGQTFVEYLHEVRIERAKELIRLGVHTMTQICFQVGFRHLSHFIRTFKKRTGLTPTEYKKSVMNN
ncbi:AraC family transcriptional regulator [Paenibacillus oceani]|uniref:Helix-turn-helix domain-containing protein n=1 Tax=Paenibacillus oceani TaxID=2772510 RepID=A0A927CAD7_9BACL|nr:AraC family transcriptional regulator [Paenibacillus oceani]MBD2864389.1 helix-turn-helix domain-containing protein [Paenibacillus oceani]